MSNFLSVIIVAIGLSMDTFSLSVVYGTLGINRSRMIKLSILVGIFHFLMPVLGELVGDRIMQILPIGENTIVGVIFLALAVQILSSLFKEEQIKDIKSKIAGILFAFTVSIDSFSVGIGINAICNNHYQAAFIFMIVSFLFTFTGLLLGKKINNIIGKKAQILGIIILVFLSIKYLFF